MAGLYRSVFEQIIKLTNDIIIVTEANVLSVDSPRIIYVNNAFSDLTGYTTQEVIGKSPRLLQGPDSDPETRRRIRRALLRQEPVRETILNYGKSGQTYWLDINIIPLTNSNGEITHFAAIERDVTELKKTEAALLHKAMHDGLTNLFNRTAFIEHAVAEFFRSRRYGHDLCVIALDIDHFKQINDTYGHAAGDAVLRQLGNTLRRFGRSSDLSGRMGGEEMATLLPETSLSSATELAEKLRTQISETAVSIGGTEISVSASLGVTGISPSDTSFEILAERADQAMYMSKRNGRNQVTVADGNLRSVA